MQTFLDVLCDYLGEVSATNLRDHFDIVYQVSNCRRLVFLLYRISTKDDLSY